MSMNAKVLVKAVENGGSVNPFEVVYRIERALSRMINDKAKSLQKEGESLFYVKRVNGLRMPTTTISGSETDQFLYTSFAMGEGENRRLQIWIDQSDYDVMPSKGTVYLSLGMWGDYRQILAACALALSKDDNFLYLDDGMEGSDFIDRAQLEAKMAAVSVHKPEVLNRNEQPVVM